MRLLLPLILLLLPSLLGAQDRTENTRQVKCRFLCFGGRDKPSTVNTMGPNGAPIACPLSTSKISDPVTCLASGNTLVFTAGAEGKPVAKATIAAGIRAAILIFVPAPKGAATPWKVITIEDSAKNFPDGGVFVANFHSDDIRFIVGEHKGALRPGQTGGYAQPKERDTFNMAPVIFQFRNKEKWRIGNESALRFLPGMRYLIFAYTDPRSQRPRINTYQDFHSVATAKP